MKPEPKESISITPDIGSQYMHKRQRCNRCSDRFTHFRHVEFRFSAATISFGRNDEKENINIYELVR